MKTLPTVLAILVSGLTSAHAAAINVTSGGDFTFQGDSTYLVNGTVTLSGTATFEGGAVIKYSQGASLNVTTIKCLATPYRPVVFTAKDDDSVGQMVIGSTHNPTVGAYANPALSLSGPPPSYWTMANFRIAFAQQAISASSISFDLTLRNGQLVNCANGIQSPGQGPIHLRNLLFSNVQNAFNGLGVGSVDAENTTFGGSINFPYTPAFLVAATPANPFPVYLRNCVVANMSTFLAGIGVTFDGDHNGFYNTPPPFGIDNAPTPPTPPFEPPSGAGNYYLNSQSGFRDAGTTGIDPTLLSDLKKKTTYPPAAPPSPQPNGTTWAKTALRDDDGLPDLGYHYDALDYLCTQYGMSGAPHTLANGVSIGFYGAAGFNLQGGGGIVSNGRAEDMNHLVWYPSVQEQPIRLDNVSTYSSALFKISAVPNTPKLIVLKFTDLAMQGDRQRFFDSGVPYNWPYATLSDCWLRGVNLTVNSYYLSGNAASWIDLRNNLLERCTVTLYNGYSIYFYGPGQFNVVQNPLSVMLHNNLFWRSAVSLTYKEAQDLYKPGWQIHDNLFDNCPVGLNGDGNYSSLVVRSHNGFFNTTPGNLSGAGNVTLFALGYASSPLGLGPWYIDPAVTTPTLINVGSRTAPAAGLFHHTVQPDQAKEGNTPVDIGFHYVALDTTGKPVDGDRDGTPDYIEDANGNGVVDPGESPWILRKVVVNANYGWHQWGNAIATSQRATPGWEPWLGGNNGGNSQYNALNIVPPTGDAFLHQVVDLGFAAIDDYDMAGTYDDAGYYALENGSSVFSFTYPSNARGYFDYYFAIFPSASFRGRGPTSVAMVAGGGLSSSGSANQYGPQGEFIDAICYDNENGSGCGCSYWDTAQSWAHAAVAAKYATVRDAHPDWNPFDIRQYLRQVSTFYHQSWTDPITSRTFYGWRLDGGYGFPQVAQQCGGTPIGTPVPTGLPPLADVWQSQLDAGPPLLPWMNVADDRQSVTFHWRNWLQTGFYSTMIKMTTDGIEANAVQIYETTDRSASSFTWTQPVTGNETFYFYTKLDDGRVSRTEVFTSLSAIVPRIDVQPQSQSVSPGANVTLTVTAVDQDPFPFQGNSLYYYWYRNGALYSYGSASLTLYNVQPSDAGNYTVKVANRSTFLMSQAATLTVQ